MIELLYVLCGLTLYQWWAGSEKVVSLWVNEHWPPNIAGLIEAGQLFSLHLEVYPMLIAARSWGVQ